MSKPVTPLLAVDGIIVYKDKFILIERMNDPKGISWPGGFVDVGESVEDAVQREMLEEVNLRVEITNFVGVYSDPDRDPRGHVVSLCYMCRATGGTPAAKDDAKSVFEMGLSEVLQTRLVFDHNQMMIDALDTTFLDRRE